MKPKAETAATPLAVIGVDNGKDVFHLVGLAWTERLPSGGRSGDWASETPSRSYRRVSLAWRPA
jgi:hypothetical protein